MHRRSFAKLLGAVLMGSTSGMQAVQNTPTSKKKRIVVIGAGLAGLAAARELQARGHEVVVVEARERIGGRIWTSTKWPDMPLDLGASWIHGVKGNPLTTLADQIGAKRVLTSYDSTLVYNTTGQPLTGAEENRLEALRQQVQQALRVAQNADPDKSIRQAIEPLMSRHSNVSEAHRFINFILSGTLEQEYAGSADRLSAHWYDSAKEYQGDDALFVDGYKVLTDFLASNLQIQLGQVVKEVRWNQSPVHVLTQKTDFRADHVIITLPLGVLQAGRVRFTPELPRSKQNAISKLEMGVLNKCYLRFPKVFWPADVDWLEHISQNHGEWTEWVSFKRTTNVPVLLGFNAADRGREIEAWSDGRIVASAMQTLKTIFGSGIPEPVDYQITRWATDPFAMGSYSYNPVGTVPQLRKELARPLNKLVFFAGEASSSDYFGTAHGAYLSGLRAAREVLAV